MPYVVELLLDEEAAGEVRLLWKSLAEAGVPARYLDLDLAPHVTIAVFDELAPAVLTSPDAIDLADFEPAPTGNLLEAPFELDGKEPAAGSDAEGQK